MHVGLFERFLHLAHSGADHWAWAGTSGVNEICDPDFAGEIGTTEWFAILVGELKWRDRAVVLDLSAGQTLNFDVT
jgi:hypothetical protein